MVEGDLAGKFLLSKSNRKLYVIGKSPHDKFWVVQDVPSDGTCREVHEDNLRGDDEVPKGEYPPCSVSHMQGKIGLVVCGTCEGWKVGKECISFDISNEGKPYADALDKLQDDLRVFFSAHKQIVPYVWSRDGKVHVQFIEDDAEDRKKPLKD